MKLWRKDRNTYKIHDNGSLGEVQIADEVVAIIAGLAATEVDGVGSMAGNITNELVGKLGMKNLSKGVKVDVLEDVVCVDLALNIEYGFNILETSKKVQERVKSAIENNDRSECFRCECADCQCGDGKDQIRCKAVRVP